LDSIKEILPILDALIAGLGKHFGPNCEFVVHDYESDDVHTIVSIVNGDVTHRKVGDPASGVGLRILQGTAISNGETDGLFNYVTQTREGRVLKSSTIYLKNDRGKIIGSLCVNYDITEMQAAFSAMSEFLNTEDQPNKIYEADKTVSGDIDDLLVRMITDSINYIGKPVAQMSKQDKIEGIGLLQSRGAFKIQHSADIVAQYYNVSKYTVYNYLGQIANKEERE